MIRTATAADAAAIINIYNHYIATTTISFEENPVTEQEMAQRIKDVSASLPWYVEEQDGVVIGYAYATPWRARSAYRFSVESTVYVATSHEGQGIGKRLYQTLIADLRQRGIHVIIGGIAQPNAASVALHESLGFEKVAHFKDVGRKFEQWVDVGYWELQLN
ncbi:N-acetyltransferase [Undibacterium sp. YM2]|uniref:arsinothricin resistance N-acetyltransferase ArsN1 family B n=1 Tax=Undibacterium sp. YM2 TaxID=2058625 RepID=UPI001331DEFE|nr:arsinothricin resistance N-acetyltransferase ArsN1 family B [Undibacterium sp. YM2]BBB68208.1 N-acetyltransferase [Undibacterium sp. YM2]